MPTILYLTTIYYITTEAVPWNIVYYTGNQINTDIFIIRIK